MKVCCSLSNILCPKETLSPRNNEILYYKGLWCRLIKSILWTQYMGHVVPQRWWTRPAGRWWPSPTSRSRPVIILSSEAPLWITFHASLAVCKSVTVFKLLDFNSYLGFFCCLILSSFIFLFLSLFLLCSYGNFASVTFVISKLHEMLDNITGYKIYPKKC